jgi:4-amino-4-deoxy-L-arabinose transferase-like glycosyltransferase
MREDRLFKKLEPLVVVGLLTLAAFGLRLVRLGQHSLWYDELLQADIAQGPFFEIGPQLVRHAAMPLDYYLLHGWLKWGQQDTWVRLPALFFGVLAVPLIYACAKRLFNQTVGYVAAGLLTVATFAITYSRETRPYALLMTLVLVAYLALWQAYRTGRFRYWALFIVGIAGAALTHYFALFLLLPMGLYVAIQQLYHIRQAKFWQFTGLFGLALIVLFAIFLFNGRLNHLYGVGNRFTKELGQLEAYTLPAAEKPNRGSGPPIELTFFREKVLTPLATVEPGALLLYGVFLLLGVAQLVRVNNNKNRPAILLLLGWLILPILLIYAFLLHRGTFYAIRYILYTLPAFLILVAFGLDSLARLCSRSIQPSKYLRRATQIILISVLLSSMISAQWRQLQANYNADSREDWRAVGRLLFDNAAPNDTVIAVQAEPAINWYYPPGHAPFGTYSRSEPIWQAMQQHPRRWFVLSSYSFKRDKGLRDWLSNQQAVKIAIDQRVVVYFHQEGLSGREMLAQVKNFELPQKPLTYRILADQFKQLGDDETSRALYQKADALANASAQGIGLAQTAAIK